MDQIIQYRSIIINILEEYSKIKYANLEASNSLVIDKENDRYLVLTIGWEGAKRIHSSPIHFDIIDKKIVIQSDHTDYGIANDLLDAGVPKSDIILGYYSPEKGAELGFAVLEESY